MTYIKLTNEMELLVTKRDFIYRGDNMSSAVIFLIPLNVSGINVKSASVFLSYVRADGTPDIVILEPDSSMYDSVHYKYILPVTCKLSRYPGEVCMWLQIYSGDSTNPTVKKSGNCTIHVLDSKNLDDCLEDHQLTALYQLKKKLDEITDSTTENPDGSGDTSEEGSTDSEGFPSIDF